MPLRAGHKTCGSEAAQSNLTDLQTPVYPDKSSKQRKEVARPQCSSGLAFTLRQVLPIQLPLWVACCLSGTNFAPHADAPNVQWWLFCISAPWITRSSLTINTSTGCELRTYLDMRARKQQCRRPLSKHCTTIVWVRRHAFLCGAVRSKRSIGTCRGP